MQLLTDGRSIRVAQSGPDFLILSEATQIPVGEAELIVVVNGDETKQPFLIKEPVDGVRVEVGDGSQKEAKTVEVTTA